MRSRWFAGAIVLALVTMMSGINATAAPVLPKPVLHGPESVTDGHARFEILTPTLIRLEYSGDDRFQDSPTFNVPNRNFPAIPYTTDVANGYREIHTASLTLRYREGSGPFTSANTTVQLGSV